MITVAHNLSAMNVQRQFGINTRKDKKNVERLSSGYRINRAADDAAGLVISEKMRQQIRGLNQGTDNAQDGISWVQIGDGALNEVHDMLHRMNELTVQSLNDTYTDADRAAMEAEFDQLQSQIDNITQNTKFNTKDIFSEHEPTYYKVEGNITWPHDQVHDIYSPENTLEISYRVKEDDPPVSVSLTVPEGSYTTQELADEIEDAIAASPLAYDPKLHFEYSSTGTFNANLEGGALIDSVGGGLSALLNETYRGGSAGALIGTTIFTSENAALRITSGKNDHMRFVIEGFDGSTRTQDLTIPAGRYTRNQLIDLMNDRLSGTGVQATKYGTGIMLSGDDCIISQFKGNMFQIDGAAYTSVFYDNVYHGEVSLTPGTFTGGAVLPTNERDAEHSFFDIKTGVNDVLTFKANGAQTETTITIPQGKYAIGDMITRLNQLFNNNGLDITATSYRSGGFDGIKLTSDLRGATSDVGLSQSSSAFNTLFVERKYNVYGAQATITNESRQDNTSSFTGSKSFTSANYDNLPLTIKTGVNDSFSVNIDGTVYTAQITAATYNSANAVKNAVADSVYRAVPDAYKEKITTSLNGSGQITFAADISARIVNLSAGAVSGNGGYADIFTTSYKDEVRYIGGSSGSLDRTFPEPSTITEAEKYIRIESTDGKASYNLELPTGTGLLHSDIINKINESTGKSTFTDIEYHQNVTNGTDRNFTVNAQGTTSYTNRDYTSTGVTVEGGVEGQVGDYYSVNTPASVTIPLKDSFTPQTGSDEIKLTLNGQTRTLTFDHRAYTPASFATAMQEKINAVFGTNFGGATVSVSGTGIKITSRLNDVYGEEKPARDTNISCSTSTSSLLKELNTTRGTGSLTTPTNSLIPASGINVSAGDTFEFTLNGERKSVSLTEMTNGSGSTFAIMLNSRLQAEGIPVSASAVSYNGQYRLQLTTKNPGSENRISYSSGSGGTVSSALYGDLTTSGYDILGSVPMKENITIEEGKNVFVCYINGSSQTISLDPRTCSREDIVNELNSKLSGASASIVNGYLKVTSDRKGIGSTVSIPYDHSSNSAMRAIWGQTESRAPALTASFDSTDHLILTSREDGREFRIPSTGNGYVEWNRTSTTVNPSRVAGRYYTTHASIDGVNLNISDSNPLIIDEWNDTLKFNYFKGTTPTAVSFNVTHGSYTSYGQLASELQNKIDNILGSGEVTVTADAGGVVIRAVEAGSTRGIGSVGYSGRVIDSNKFGDFYDKVMCRATETTVNQPTSKQLGSNVAGTDKIPYVIGRRNVKDKPVKIKSDINDTLSLDFAYTDEYGRAQSKTLTMKLDPGTYQGSSLSSVIQDKLNNELRNIGLAENLIEVGIGGTNAHVAGVDNDKVLTFKLSNSLPLPSSGEYIIDGIGGNAAFSVFYQTTGELVPAYVEGVKNITGETVIEDGHNILSFTVDGRDYSIEIPPGTYEANEMIDELNSLLSGQNAPVKAEMSDEGTLKLSHKKMGKHPIENLGGTARGSLFFNEYSGQDEESSIRLQFSSVLDDHKYIDRPTMSTSFLGINTISITKPKYAKKALERIQGALDRVSEVRSYFGASQNAIEHVVNRNNNTSENTQAAESRIRDTDMAKAIVEHSKQSILIQAGQAMLTQANSNSQSVLRLLQ